MNTPKVSILIPVYNRENFILPCIESALSQTLTDIEVIVVDNASTDSTWDICKHYANIDARVRIFRNETNIGPVRNWLACLAEARGEYTKILWSDDLIHSEFLSMTIPYLNRSDVGFVYSSANVFAGDKLNVLTHSFTKLESGIYISQIYIEGVLFNQDFPFSPGCAIFRTVDVKNNLLLSVPNRVNSDSSMHAIGNDLLLFLLTAQQYDNFAVIREPLAYFRAHKSSITTSAPPGKIPLHYDLVKGFFAEAYITDKALLRRLNSEFFLHLLKFKSKNFGIKKLSDFYPSTDACSLDWRWIFNRFFRKMFIL